MQTSHSVAKTNVLKIQVLTFCHKMSQKVTTCHKYLHEETFLICFGLIILLIKINTQVFCDAKRALRVNYRLCFAVDCCCFVDF